MLTREQTPWIDYILVDENTGKVFLRPDTPPEIQTQYEKYLEEQPRNEKGMMFK